MEQLFSTLAEGFDLPILDWIAGHLRCPFLDVLMPLITHLGDAGILWILLAVLFFCIPKYRKTGLSMALSLAMGLLLCNILLKPLVARPRPFDYQLVHFQKTIPLLISAPTDFSFPSGHTIASFEAATAICLRHKKWGFAAYIPAGLIAFSRLYLYVHYPTDVLASVVLGIGLGFAGTYLCNQIMKNKH